MSVTRRIIGDVRIPAHDARVLPRVAAVLAAGVVALWPVQPFIAHMHFGTLPTVAPAVAFVVPLVLVVVALTLGSADGRARPSVGLAGSVTGAVLTALVVAPIVAVAFGVAGRPMGAVPVVVAILIAQTVGLRLAGRAIGRAVGSEIVRQLLLTGVGIGLLAVTGIAVPAANPVIAVGRLMGVRSVGVIVEAPGIVTALWPAFVAMPAVGVLLSVAGAVLRPGGRG